MSFNNYNDNNNNYKDNNIINNDNNEILKTYLFLVIMHINTNHLLFMVIPLYYKVLNCI